MVIDVEIERVKLLHEMSDIFKSLGISNATLANLTMIDAANICRIFKGRYSPTLDIVLRLLSVADYTLTFKRLCF